MAIRRASAPQQAVEGAERDAPPAAAEEEPDVPLREGAEVVARDAPRAAAAAPDARPVAAVARSDGPRLEVMAEVV